MGDCRYCGRCFRLMYGTVVRACLVYNCTLRHHFDALLLLCDYMLVVGWVLVLLVLLLREGLVGWLLVAYLWIGLSVGLCLLVYEFSMIVMLL